MRTRSGGPGGQHRNKVDTAIVITHDPTGVTAQAGEKRSQHANLAVAIGRLKINLAIAVRSDPLPSQTSQLWISRTKNGRIAVSPSHSDFPLLISEALDVLAIYQNDLVASAEHLGVSTSQLVKLLKSHRQVFDHVQETRKACGLHRLK